MAKKKKGASSKISATSSVNVPENPTRENVSILAETLGNIDLHYEAAPPSPTEMAESVIFSPRSPVHALLCPVEDEKSIDCSTSKPFIPACYKWNGVPTNGSQTRLMKLLAGKKREIMTANKRILTTRELISASEAAISNLENTIERAYHVTITMQICLRSLETVCDNIKSLDTGSTSIDSTKESNSFKTCHTVISYIGLPSQLDELKSLPDQTTQLLERIENLERMTLQMKKEPLDWRMELEFHQYDLKQLEIHHKSLGEVINGIKSILSAMRRIPTEIWVKVFDYWVRERDLEAAHHSLPSPLLLGQVCSSWRQIVLGTPALWVRFDIYKPTLWPQSVLDNLERAKQAAASNDLHYTFFGHFNPAWGHQVQQFHNPYAHAFSTPGHFPGFSTPTNGRIGTPTKEVFAPVPSSILTGFLSTHLHVGISFDFHIYTPPVNAIKTLTLTGASTGWGSNLKRFLESCSSVEELILENIWLTGSNSLSMPNLKRLCFRIDRFEPFDISVFLHSQIRDLDIRHNGSDTVELGSSAAPCLTHLRHLAITPHEYPLLTHIMTPNLKSITLYPANQRTAVVISSPGLQSVNEDLNSTLVGSFITSLLPKLQKVGEIKFIEWTIQSTIDCVYVLEKILSVSSLLQHVRFEQCHLNGPALICLIAKANSGKIDTEELLATTVPKLDDTNSFSLSATCRLKSLAELTLSSCTGLTRGQCDVLASTVGKLNIYV
ncbi:SubName: Full=Uncharacterized protein {ECO:0000313/EMBL:CCA76139.1} [Serendipita indica DSM 11827]|uniref:Uncharacterized protein n=1 Tax=Serendipita indica (strain DSM 11827) TaxID=1109443 RepID=G4TXU6_SERID|nr:SubName: Full=Uncharacterized protein {ECO:0000313/EMBL:CCA76139.1} [Serendipita indica DSM 11827]CCA76139.1 hypothetical protein PIIN_10139 [Serendipita indica DSM 11827]